MEAALSLFLRISGAILRSHSSVEKANTLLQLARSNQHWSKSRWHLTSLTYDSVQKLPSISDLTRLGLLFEMVLLLENSMVISGIVSSLVLALKK